MQVQADAQVVVSGYVYDLSKQNPIQLVSVISTQGRGTVTDSNGHYSLTVYETDSIYFSYLNKPTQRFAVSSMLNPERFNISIHINVAELPNVKVRQRNYKEDSIRNRENYAKIFNFQKPTLGISNSPGNIAGGAGFNLDELINVFRFKRNKRLAKLQKRLIEEEQDKYIDNRFSKRIVLRLTGLSGSAQDTFMYKYRPTYSFTTKTIDIDFYQYIQIASRHFKAHPNMPYAQVRRELQIFFFDFEEKIEN
jgi:CarboxypepD_reg-like domain